MTTPELGPVYGALGMGVETAGGWEGDGMSGNAGEARISGGGVGI